MNLDVLNRAFIDSNNSQETRIMIQSEAFNNLYDTLNERGLILWYGKDNDAGKFWVTDIFANHLIAANNIKEIEKLSNKLNLNKAGKWEIA